VRASWLFAVVAVGCSSGSPATPPATDGLRGTFLVSFVEAAAVSMTPAFAVVSGKIYDGVVPPAQRLKLDRQEGACQLFKPDTPFCDPPCAGGAVCVDDGVCRAFPKLRSVGVVRVSGLGAEELALEPVVPASPDYQSAALPHPPCAEGDAVRLRADAFEIETTCIAPLELTSAAPIPVRRGQPVALAWKAPADAAGRVSVHLDVAHHGGKKGEIDCDVADTGAFELPAALVTALLDLGIAGGPTITVTRERRATAAAEPGVALAVSSSLERAVDTGFRDCSEAMPCPAGQTCDLGVYLCK
jgi:hypothetical protein